MKLLHPLLDIWGFFRVPKGQVFRGEKKIMSLAEWGCFELAKSLESSLKNPELIAPLQKAVIVFFPHVTH